MTANDSSPRVRVRPFHLSSAILLLIVVIGEWDVLIGRSTLFLRDIGTTHLPAFEAFAKIGYAHTNPFASFGQPYLGNPNLLVAYPFPKAPALLGLYVFVHLFLALAGMLVLLRRHDLSWDASWLGAISFALSGYVLSEACSLNALTTIAWIPLVLAAARFISRNGRPRDLLWLTPLLAIFFVSGEPVLIAMALFVAFTFLRSWRSFAVFAAACTLATLIGLPVHLATWNAAMDSVRVVEGYSFEQATAASLHAARLLETIVPYLFGSPARIGPGAFWGYEVSHNARPYVYSLSLGILPCLFAALLLFRPRSAPMRWWLLFAASLILSMAGYLPGARVVYSTIPWLHVVRFPIKFFLMTTLAMSALAAHGFEQFVVLPISPPIRRRVLPGMVSAALVAVLLAAFTSQHQTAVRDLLVRLWWNPQWRSVPELVLAPIVSGLPLCFIIIAVLISFAAWCVTHGKRAPRIFIIQLLCMLELLASGYELFPSIPAAEYNKPSPLVQALHRVPGRVFERAGKDLDAVIFDLHGEYAINDVSQFALAQARQAWSLYGVRYGLRYAYDPCQDGSYTARNEMIRRLLNREPWRDRLKWLRAAGVGSVIASDLPRHNIGLRFLILEQSVGVPVAAYQVMGRLPEVRRTGAVWARSIPEAIARFEDPSFDERTAVVLESQQAQMPIPSDGGTAQVLWEGPDSLRVLTAGPGRAVLFVARSWTRRVRATSSNGAVLPVYPANVHLTGVVIPPGSQRITLMFD